MTLSCPGGEWYGKVPPGELGRGDAPKGRGGGMVHKENKMWLLKGFWKCVAEVTRENDKWETPKSLKGGLDFPKVSHRQVWGCYLP